MRPPKFACFLLEGMNAVATTYQFYYIYFFAEAKFGFDRGQNLILAAALGVAYAGASVIGGKLAQSRGYLNAHGLGCALMAFGQIVAAISDSLAFHGLAALVSVIGMGKTWPALEALACDGESGRRLQTMLGVYNLVWSFGGAFAYLSGGAMLESWGLTSMFVVPAVMNVVQVGIVLALRRRRAGPPALQECRGGDPSPGVGPNPEARRFLRMAWFANPLAYLTINTVVALGPSLANAQSLSPRLAGYVCSTWMFVRTGAFLLLWLWPGWHYRFRWLLGAYLGMIATFVLILVSPNVASLVMAQLGFGLCIGLIYYSSLYYSMDAGDAKGEHGGIHEAVIGLGSAAGPALGATAFYLAPNLPHGTAHAVGILLTIGVIGLVWIRRR